MKKIGIVLLILISLIGTLLGCGKQDVNKDLESIEASEIKQIEPQGHHPQRAPRRRLGRQWRRGRRIR